MLPLLRATCTLRSIPPDEITAVLVPCVIVCAAAMIPVTPPEGSPISIYFLVGS